VARRHLIESLRRRPGGRRIHFTSMVARLARRLRSFL
jgi:hypothetical protein